MSHFLPGLSAGSVYLKFRIAEITFTHIELEKRKNNQFVTKCQYYRGTMILVEFLYEFRMVRLFPALRTIIRVGGKVFQLATAKARRQKHSVNNGLISGTNTTKSTRQRCEADL